MTSNTPNLQMYRESAAYLAELFRKNGLSETPEIAVILGSGLGAFAEGDAVEGKLTVPYADIPHFPTSTVDYQKGCLVAGTVDGRSVLLFNGRFHYYEGWEMWQTAYPVNVCRMLGVKTMIITNAAGGINTEMLEEGDLVAINDHIKLVSDSPMRGKNEDALGERFFDMQSVYDKAYLKAAHEIAAAQGFTLKEGVYAYMAGPQYETPAEIRALRILGADVVGMSTVAEVIAAAHVGIRVLCISCVSNMAAGVTGKALGTEEVLETTARTRARFVKLLRALIDALPNL